MKGKCLSARNPAVHILQLPPEILSEIIRYLSPAEKSNVRATCNQFKDLVDQPALWQKSTIVLRFTTNFNEAFWGVLQKRKVTSVVLKGFRVQQWKKFLRFMPDLHTLTILDAILSEKAVQGLRQLKSLQKLHMENCMALSKSNFQEAICCLDLTHLHLCGVTLSTELIHISRLQNLQALSLHTLTKPLPHNMLEDILLHLPNLRELSLACLNSKETLLDPKLSDVDPRGNSPGAPMLQLCSLALQNTGYRLLLDAPHRLPVLRTLTVCNTEPMTWMPLLTPSQLAWSSSVWSEPASQTLTSSLCRVGLCY
uniref:F-box domain-containing protein n=1 Tax=Sphenodon punctatus TaxID=8508 RepID=A0A8D0GIB8_SPHPU